MRIETINWLKDYLANRSMSCFERTMIKEQPDMHAEVMAAWNDPIPPKNFTERVYQILHPTKIVCDYGNVRRFDFYKTGYRCTRSCQCSKDKFTASMIANHGVAHAHQSPAIREKMAKTLTQRYGVDALGRVNPEKRRETNLERYGVESVLKSPVVRTKIKASLMESHGVEYPWQSPELRDAAIKTVKSRYGVDNVFSLKEVRDKAKPAMLEKYGVESSFSLQSVKDKISKTFRENYGKHPSQRHISDSHLQIFNDDVAFSLVYAQLKSVKEIQTFFGTGATSIHRRAANLGLPRKRTLVSQDEGEVAQYVKSLGVDIVQSDRTIISPKEIDIVVPSRRVGIEFDGIYSHSERLTQNPTRHILKTEMAEESGYRMIHIFSDEWREKRRIVESRIKSILGVASARIHARSLDVRPVSASDATVFLDENHIQGAAGSSERWGLYRGDELISLMTFGKPRFNKDAEYELIRFCNRLDHHVPGAASRLLKAFTSGKTGKIVSYSDRRWSQGGVYKALGFEHVRNTDPGYSYVTGQSRMSRFSAQKRNQSKFLKSFDPNLSERENMEANGFYRIYDCGNGVWVYKIEVK